MIVKSDVTLDRTRDNNQTVYFAEFRLLAGTYGPLILSSYYFLLSVWIWLQVAERQDARDGELNEGMFFAAQAVIVDVMIFMAYFMTYVWFLFDQPCQLKAG